MHIAIFWYAMRSKPNKEDFLARQLETHGLKMYYPRIHVHTVNPRARQFRSYFPGYLFLQVDLETIIVSELKWMPGATGLVSFGGEPAPIPDLLIAAIQRSVDGINAADAKALDELKSGDRVVVQDGPFAGYEAIFDSRISGSERVRVLLMLLQKRQVPLDLSDRQIKRKK
ncbi:MAG: transcription termination/antitermination NusG family protein [Chloroflexota bacterium]